MTAGCAFRGWVSPPDIRFDPAGQWSVTVPLLPKELPERNAPFEVLQEWGEKRVRAVLDDLLALVPVRFIAVTYGPGVLKGVVEPCMNLEIQGPRAHVDYLASLFSEVLGIGSALVINHPDGQRDCTYTVHISDLNEVPLDKVDVAGFCGHLYQACPNLGLPKLHTLDGRFLLVFTNTGQDWSTREIEHFTEAANDTAASLGLTMAMDRAVAAVI